MQSITFNPSSFVIVLDVGLTGSRVGIAKMVLDTGASYLVVRWKLMSAIGIKIDPQKTVHTTTASSIETVPKVIIPEVIVLGKRVKNVEAIVKDLPPESHVDGLLGLSFLRNFKLTVDFKKGLLSLE